MSFWRLIVDRVDCRKQARKQESNNEYNDDDDDNDGEDGSSIEKANDSNDNGSEEEDDVEDDVDAVEEEEEADVDDNVDEEEEEEVVSETLSELDIPSTTPEMISVSERKKVNSINEIQSNNNSIRSVLEGISVVAYHQREVCD